MLSAEALVLRGQRSVPVGTMSPQIIWAGTAESCIPAANSNELKFGLIPIVTALVETQAGVNFEGGAVAELRAFEAYPNTVASW
jgi:hypothetical protein